MDKFRIVLLVEIILIFVLFGLFFFGSAMQPKLMCMSFFAFGLIVIGSIAKSKQTRGVEIEEFIDRALMEFIFGFVHLNILLSFFLIVWYIMRGLVGPNPIIFGFYLCIFIFPPLVWVYLHPTNKLRTSTRRTGLYLFIFFALLYINKQEIFDLLGSGNLNQVLTERVKFLNVVILIIGAADRLWKNVSDAYVDWREEQEKNLQTDERN